MLYRHAPARAGRPFALLSRLVICTVLFAAGLVAAPVVSGAVAATSINFQPSASIVPLGYTADSGAGYTDAAGSGWVREDSIRKPTHIALDVSPNAVDRNVHMDQRLDTFIQMDFTKSSSPPPGAVTIPAAWEMAVPSGHYQVVVSVGDAGPDLNSAHRINLEGQTTIANFVPTAANHFATATKTVIVSDGRLTIDARGGKNTKINYVEITSVAPPDTTPPAAPTNVSATAGDASVALAWNANTESDLAGYHVFRSTSSTVSTSGTPLNGTTPLTTTTFTDMSVSNGTRYYYVVVATDVSGNRSGPSATVNALPSGGTPPPPIDRAINFQPAGAPVPSGYTADTGAAYSSARGWGWLREDSIDSASPVPLDVSAYTRDRNLLTDQLLDTFAHMEYPGTVPAAWAMAVPEGDYTVVVSVGDAGPYFDSTHQISVEGQSTIAPFVPTSANRFASATRTVHVSDGLLTVDARGGTNTKIDYIRVMSSGPDSTPPAAPTNVSATPGDARVTLNWGANTEPDLAGYHVFRSTSQPVSTAGTPLSGATPLTARTFTDLSAVNGTTYHYVVLAVDAAGNRSAPSSTVSAMPTAAALTYALQVSTSASRASPVSLEGQEFTQGADIHVFTTPTTGVTRVRFFLDDPTMAGTPRTTDATAPFDFNGTAADGTATPFDTAPLAVGAHTITAAIDKSAGGTDVLQGQFTLTGGAASCQPVACESIKVALPYQLGFSSDHGFITASNGVGTGFTYVDGGTARLDRSKLLMDTTAGVLKITTTAGIMSRDVNTQVNALAVGIAAPNQNTILSTTLVNPPAGTGNYEQAGLWFGNDQDNYVKLNLQSSPTGTKVQLFAEVAGQQTADVLSGTLSVSSSRVGLTLKANPVNRTITGSYKIGTGAEQVNGSVTVPGEFFSFDAAGIDPRIGTRSFGGIFATHRFSTTALTYTFDDFSVTGTPVDPGGGGGSGAGPAFVRNSIAVPNPTSMEWGPDGRLYVSELMGKIHAMTLNSQGALVSDVVSTALGTRLTLGLTIGPESTSSNVVVYAAHSNPSIDNGTPNSGIISRLSGASLATRSDVITGLPRAIANHATNKIRFGPDGKLYIAQGGNTGAGAPNSAATEFGTMQEQPLSAALLVADINATGFDGTCANTTNIFGPAPCSVTVYASGLRNTYDFIFHSNGSIYAPDNGLGVTGTYPPSPTPPCLGMGNTASWTQGGHNPGSQPDDFNRILQGSYYGHPNPYRNECVFDDGHYQGVSPLPNHKGPLSNLGANASANGTLEYTANAFCGQLKGEVIVARYSVGDDLRRLKLSPDGLAVLQDQQLAAGFVDPLPAAMGPDGWIGVGEFSGGKVTILRPDDLGCWNVHKPLTTKLADPGGAALGDKLYVVAGKTSTGPRSEVYVYNPALDTWSTAASLPGPAVENPAIVAVGTKLYAFGGSTGPFSGAVTNAAVYDPASNAWTALPPMSVGRGGAAAAAIGTKIYVVGGMGADGASLSSVQVFDTATGTWSAAPAMSTRRDNPAAAAANGKLYVFGGRIRNADGTTTNGTLNTVEMFDPALGTWSARTSMPTGRRAIAVGRIGGKVQLMGGEASGTGSGVFDKNEEYDPATNAWRTLSPMRTPRHGAAAGTINGVVYVVAGGTATGTSFSDINDSFRFTG